MNAATLRHEQGREKKGLTGWHVLGALVAFFGLIIIANIAFIYFAVQSHRGEDVPKSYRQGLEYNQVISARAEQAALGWTVKVSEAYFEGSDRVLIEVRDANGKIVDGVEFDVRLRHPADADLDRPATIVERRGGEIVIETSDLRGRWIIKGQSVSEDQPFRFEAEVDL